MKYFTKFLCLFLGAAMMLTMAACGSKAEPSADQSTAAPIETDTKAYNCLLYTSDAADE